jgi:hypothetical protein
MRFVAAVGVTTMVLAFFLAPQLAHSRRNEDQTWVARKMLADARREWVSIKNRIGELESRVADIVGASTTVAANDDAAASSGTWTPVKDDATTTAAWAIPHDAIDDALLYEQDHEPLSIPDAYGDHTTECDPGRTPIATFWESSDAVRRTLTQYSKHLSSRAWALAISVIARE